jgi:hypothetical protein
LNIVRIVLLIQANHRDRVRNVHRGNGSFLKKKNYSVKKEEGKSVQSFTALNLHKTNKRADWITNNK